jgi:parvulin-like peptidyl-prolyl isomerase
MRSTLSALVIAAGLVGFGASAQAAPAAALPGIATESPLVQVQLTPRERMRMRDRMERRMIRRQVQKRMIRREIRRDMRRRY